ncbi:hypothetical protein F5887DRAFT_964282 [Amanita rubescens]|nr:hypothetical protein F5887DRAFT_964282 [Amanita rubescens]
MKDIVTDLLAAKRKLLAGNNAPVTTPEDSGSSSKIPAQSAELPERTRNSAKSSKVASKAFCLACTKASKHDLADCPLVQEGPLAIQKRIKALRATKKYSDKEKTPVIEGLKQVKQDIRDKAKQSTKESKVNAQSHSHPSSRPQDAEANDVSDRINDVAGVSSQARPVTQLSNKGSSGTSSTDSTPGAVVQLSAEKQADGDGSLNSLIPSHNVDLSAVDLQELIRGPKEALVSVNDLPSSDENDDDERMSGGPEEDEVEKNYRRLTSFGNDSSESEGSDAEQDNGNPTGSFANTEQHVSVSDSQDAIPEPGPPTVTQEQSIPRPSGRDDVSGDKDDANRRDGVLQEEESAIGTKSPVNGQEASDPVVSQEATEATLDALSAPTEEPDLSAMRAPSDASESIQSTQSSPRHVNGSSVIEQISDDTRVGPVRRSNRRTKPSVVTEETATEQDSGKRKRAATKTPKKDKSLTQVKDDILNSVARTIKSKIRATSVPADEHEPRTPGRKRARVTTKIERALNSKGNDTSTSKSRKKKDVPVPSENDPSITPSQDQTSLRSATPSVPEWTTLTPMEDDNITRDEPAPSSPLLRKSNANKKGVKKITKQSVVEKANEDLPNTLDDDLLFAPSTSQIPYPYSQKLHIEKRRENDSEDEQEVTSFLTPNGRTPHKYRRLSDIGTNPFAKRLNPNLAQHHSSKVDKVKELYGRRGKRGDNKSDSDSDSDSEPEKISHIPKTRMAGA